MTVDQLFWWIDRLQAEMLPDPNLDTTRTVLLSEATVADVATTHDRYGYPCLEQIRRGERVGELAGFRLEPQPDSTAWILTITHPLKGSNAPARVPDGKTEEDAIVALWEAEQGLTQAKA